MIIQANNRLWHFEAAPGMAEADVLKAMPVGAMILNANDETLFRAVKLPTVDAPIDVNTANRFQMLTITNNDIAAAETVIKMRPFINAADFQNRAAKLVNADMTKIAFGSGSGGAAKQVAAQVINT